MALHAAVMMALFMDQVTQAPVVVQCLQSPPESWVKWLLPTIVQTVVSLASIAAGVLIAIWSFRASSRREHQRWILDQKKEEWREILSAVTEVQKDFPPIYETEFLTIGKEARMVDELANKWNEIEHRIDVVAIMPFIFIWQKLVDIKFYENWKDVKEKASKDIASMPKLIENRSLKQLYTSMKEFQTGPEYRDPRSVYCDLLYEYGRIVKALRSHAETDLNIRSIAKSVR